MNPRSVCQLSSPSPSTPTGLPSSVTLEMIVTSGASAGTLGLIAEPAGTGASSGPVQTFRLTAASVYTALESGLDREALVGFLREHNAGALPPNVLQTLAEWSARREAMVVRSGLRLTAFPNREARDAYLADERQATACGERFVL